MIRARTLTVSDMTDLEREVFEELARKNPGTKLAQLCAHTHSFEQGGRYSFSYWDEPSLVDLSPLVRLQTLSALHVGKNTALADLSPLADCPDLEELEAYDTAVADLSPLAGHPRLKKITLSGTPVTDVSPLATIPTLEMIWLYGTAVEDVSCLAALPRLNDLNLYKTKVTDLSAFQGRESILGIERSKLGIKKAGKDPAALQKAIEEIRERLDRLGIVPRPKLKRADITAFQERTGSKLPREYAAFLTKIGDGFEVTFRRFTYRLPPLAEVRFDPEGIKKRFGRREGWCWETDEKATNKAIEAALTNGQIELVDCGCGQSYNLIVRGGARGEVWNMTDVGVSPCGNGADFLDWLAAFLDGEGEVRL